MKFMKFGKALLMTALSAAVILSISSCVQSYTVGFLYVTGTETAQSTGNGIITAYKIDHNTGKLTAVNGFPISSGGANPVRAVLISGSRFLYVLNRGTTASGSANCTTAAPCQNSNITQFAVGANGILTAQETFFTQGINPFRMIGDASGTYLYVLDHDSPDNTKCSLALGAGVNACGDITAFKIDSTTGRLSLVVNAQVSTANGQALPYFPVPANPVDFVLASSTVVTISGKTTPASYPYTGATSAFPYAYNSGSGQLTISQNSAQPLGIAQGNAITYGNGYEYVLDNEPITINGQVSSQSQILPFQLGTNGSLNAQTGGAVPDDTAQSNPIFLLVESKNKWAYVANQGSTANTTSSTSGITGYVIDPTTHQLSELPGLPFGTGSGPQCLVEDPSNQFLYTANFNDSTVTGREIDQNSGQLKNLPSGPGSYTLQGPATWCLVDGRTS